MKKNTPIMMFLIIITATLSFCYGQNTQHKIKKIDTLFSRWNEPHHPGGVVTIFRKDTLLFSKEYGMASIEYSVPNKINTIFNIGSIAKQFTALGIILLEKQKKLNINDDIRKHLPDFPDMGTTITIKHLLYHTSGIRDLHGLLALAGWRKNDVMSTHDIYRIIKKQKTLNYLPGEEFSYCNTGYILLAKIIENISHSTFSTWMKKNIFTPLGMQNTYIKDSHDALCTNTATSYYGNKDFKQALDYWAYYGSGNIYSTTNDLITWLKNFTSSSSRWKNSFTKLLVTGVLNNGTSTNYGFGIRVENHLNRKVIQHGGLVGGYRAIIRSYPEEDIHIVILSNYSGSDILSKTDIISQLLLDTKKHPVIENKKAVTSPEFTSLSKKQLSKFEGIYWNPTEKYGRTIYIKNDTLRYHRSANNEHSLLPLNTHTFLMENTENVQVQFEMTNKHDQKMIVIIPNEPATVFTYHSKKLKTNSLAQYIGSYYSEELKTTYSISLENNTLYIEHIQHGKIKLMLLYNDIFSADWPINCLEVKRNKKGIIEGIKISNGRTRNVWFKKIK
ncbi:serine hydrolase domain-containing protein [Aquimarina hainanensis]|uniref:Serine hydrolase domain-containing protein n=1 Tax=Aquimarina hainanensis TaxID=1578017 RepID=A0ABW5N5K6_9FLAO